MTRAAVLAAFLAGPAVAQPFVEVGLGAATGGCLYDGYTSSVALANAVEKSRLAPEIACSRNPLGLVAVGYEFDDQWRVQWEHWSGLTHKDRGVEILSIRYRYTFK